MSALGAKVRPAQPRRELLARERLARLLHRSTVDCRAGVLVFGVESVDHRAKK